MQSHRHTYRTIDTNIDLKTLIQSYGHTYRAIAPTEETEL